MDKKCPHPARRIYSWVSRDIETILWACCCDCGKVLGRKNLPHRPSQRENVQHRATSKA